ncbi:chorismate mutase [Streptomyces luteogriseus]|uniref:chorismate mutase n=1 Tax=Streptomyces luteogriseus TaxID=68233 RepID=UPI00367D47B7
MTETADNASRISQDRKAIDTLDARIIELFTQRSRVPSLIQKIRTDAGGPRTVFSREMEILARYREGLGECGAQIALILRRGDGALQPVAARPGGFAS